MAGKLISTARAAITGVSATGYLTVASTTGFYVGAFVNLTNSAGTVNQPAKITELTSTTIGIQFVLARYGGARYGRDDVTAFNTGTIDQDAQLIYNPNEAPLT